MSAASSSNATTTPHAGMIASAPRWIWAVVAVVLALLVGLATGMATRNQDSSKTAQADATAGSKQKASKQKATAAEAAPACPTCGVVESVRAVKQQGQGTGVGAVAGGVTGGVVGHQFGKGSGNTAMTVLGAVGGAFAGNAIEKNVRATTVYETQVRMADGNLRSFREATALAIGSHVKVEGTHLKIQAAAAQD